MTNSPFGLPSTDEELPINPIEQAVKSAPQDAAEQEVLESSMEDDSDAKQEIETQQDEQKKGLLDFVKAGRDFGAAAPAGVLDFGADMLNMMEGAPGNREVYAEIQKRNKELGIPDWLTLANEHGDVPKLPKFKNKLAQALRDISSFVAPTAFFTSGFMRAGQGIQSANAVAGGLREFTSKLGADPLFALFSRLGLSSATGVGVDYTNSNSYEGHNASGFLKNTWPEFYEWIPDNIATVDGDMPDVIRDKNIKESVVLGIFTDLAVGAGEIARAIKGISSLGNKYIPRNETANAFFSNPQKFTDKTKEALPQPAIELRTLAEAETGDELMAALMNGQEVVDTSITKRLDEIDEIGTYNSLKDADLDEPLMGLHDNLEATELGVRTTDTDGIIGATVDAARIQNNANSSYGRIRNFISEAAIKYGLDSDALNKRSFLKFITNQILEAGEYDVKGLGFNLTFKQIDEAGTELARVLFDPAMDTKSLKQMLAGFKDSVNDISLLNDIGYNGVMKAAKQYIDEYFNLDTLKAQAYLTHSLSGQVSDMAEGMRLMDGTDAVSRAQEQIIDRLTYMIAEKGLVSQLRGRNLAHLNLWKNLKRLKPKAGQEVVDGVMEEANDVLGNVVKRAKQYRETLHNIRKANPEFLKPLMLINELTDGNVDSMYKLNEYVMNKLGTYSKGFIDSNPEIPSVVLESAMGNVYNSMLSAVSTFNNAAKGNSALLLERPAAIAIGALASPNTIKALKKGWYQYSAVIETLQKGLNHMGKVFATASRNPNEVPYIIRDDMVVRNQDEIDALRSAADAYSMNGEDGPAVMLNFVEMMNDLSNHPILRLIINGMSGLDGMTRAMNANIVARGRAYEQLENISSKELPDALAEASKANYKAMTNGEGWIMDDEVEYMTREIALSLDTPQANGITMLLKAFPAMKPWMMFARTSMNYIGSQYQRSPLGVFAGEYNKIVGLPGKVHTGEEIAEILKERGIKFNTPEEGRAKFEELQVMHRGRMALGQLVWISGAALFMNDRGRGDGHFDKETQKLREEMGWKKRTIKSIDGKWYSFDGFGPASDILAFTFTVMDNFDLLSIPMQEEWSRKVGLLIGSSFVNKSMMAGLKPLMDMLSGNPASWNRWAASYSSSYVPFSGYRNELGRFLYPQLRELQQEFAELLRNRNAWMDVFDPKGALPYAYDFIDGDPINQKEGFWQRFIFAYSPIKQFDETSPERQFLIDIEFDAQPSVAKSSGGVEFTPDQISELKSLIGKEGHFKAAIQQAMKDAEKEGYIEKLRKARRFPNFKTSEEVDSTKFAYIHQYLHGQLRDAVAHAEGNLSEYEDLQQQAADQKQNIRNAELGILNLEPK